MRNPFRRKAGVDHKTVAEVRRDAGGEISHHDNRIGLDGVAQSAPPEIVEERIVCRVERRGDGELAPGSRKLQLDCCAAGSAFARREGPKRTQFPIMRSSEFDD